MARDHHILIQEKDKIHKISKITFYNDGGFAVLAPYQKAHEGFLCRMVADYRLGKQKIGLDAMARYYANSRVKLSFHSDGYIHFSSEEGNTIISGKDALTQKEKGLGIKIAPLNVVIKSGPTFSINIWGIDDFDTIDRPKNNDLVFLSQDCPYRYCNKQTCNGYIIEGFLFKKDESLFITSVNNQDYVKKSSFWMELKGQSPLESLQMSIQILQ